MGAGLRGGPLARPGGTGVRVDTGTGEGDPDACGAVPDIPEVVMADQLSQESAAPRTG
ncbi:hypothetical protein JCM18897A_15380 [Streptomyces sp. JCM 18897]